MSNRFSRLARRLFLCLVPALLAFSTSTESTRAQVLYGSVTGLVTDTSGGAIPGAEVTVVNQSTNFRQTALTNDVGIFTLRNIPDGRYTLRVALEGFKEFVASDVLVTAGQVTRRNVTLQVGERSFHYRIVQKELVQEQGASPEQHRENARWIAPTNDERLTLVTCWPYTSNSHRLIIVAKPAPSP